MISLSTAFTGLEIELINGVTAVDAKAWAFWCLLFLATRALPPAMVRASPVPKAGEGGGKDEDWEWVELKERGQRGIAHHGLTCTRCSSRSHALSREPFRFARTSLPPALLQRRDFDRLLPDTLLLKIGPLLAP